MKFLTLFLLLSFMSCVQQVEPIDENAEPAKISGVQVLNISTDRAQIKWSLDVAGSGYVEYGFTSSYGSISPKVDANLLDHVIQLANLSDDKLYHFRIVSIDKNLNRVVSGDLTFKTLATSSPAPSPTPTPTPTPTPPQAQPAAPVLVSAVRSGDNYVLSISQPSGSLMPAGGYDTFINDQDQSDNGSYSGLTRSISGLDKYQEQCFKVEARYTQLNPSVFPASNQICVAALAQPTPTPTPNPSPTPMPPATSAELKAFPSAFGGGAYATGGRGGKVYHVTKLTDDGSEGTLRWALGRPRPAIIVFDVSGTIDLKSWLTLSGKDLTIAGQTAPVGGITITSKNKSRFRAQDMSNQVIRYIRIRPLDSGNDAFEFYGNNNGANNIIMDHVSASYGGDETISVRGRQTYNITFQRMLIAEAKTGSLFGDSSTPEYSYNNSYLNSLFWNISHRTPNTATNGRVDIINNVVQNWQYRMTFARGDTKLNHINNYYAMGRRTSLTGGSQKQINALDSFYDHEVYTAGNIVDKGIFTDPNADNKILWAEFASGTQTEYAPASEFVNQAHPLIGAKLPIKSAVDAYQDVIQNVGANASLNADGSVSESLDINDREYLEIMAQGEGAYEAYRSSSKERSWITEKRYLDFVNNISSTPINTRPSNYDTDRDGMPNQWEIANGLNPNVDDSAGDKDGDGYTNIEEFLNQVDY